MPENYLFLPQGEQAQILRTLSVNSNINRDPLLLEKDIWVCWALEQLFKIPDAPLMAFKGGTSLSKGFKAINRFSEDVDITIDYQSLSCDNPFEEGVSKSKIKKISEQLKAKVSHHLNKTIAPYFTKLIHKQFGDNPPSIEVLDDGDLIITLPFSCTSKK